MNTGMIKGLVVGIILIYVAIMFVTQMTPQMESNISSANISNETTSMMVDMSEWVIPTLIMVGVIMAGLAIFKIRGSRGAADINMMLVLFPVVGWFVIGALLAYSYFHNKRTVHAQSKDMPCRE